jgi:uncharacterized cupredoxin-like copper-binding protein
VEEHAHAAQGYVVELGRRLLAEVSPNNGSIPHNLSINGQQTPNIDPGSTATLKVNFTKPGSYPYLCTIPGHAEAGMKGVLKVN